MRTLILVILVGSFTYLALSVGAQSTDFENQQAAERARADAAVAERDAALVRVAELEKQSTELRSLTQSMEQERREKADQIAGLSKAFDDLTIERDRLSLEFAAAVARNGELSAQADALRKSLAEKDLALEELQNRLVDAQSRLATRDMELAGARRRVLELETRLVTQEALVRSLRQQVATLTEELEVARAQAIRLPLFPAALLVVGGLPFAAHELWHRHRRRKHPLTLSRQPRWLALADERAYYHAVCRSQRKRR